MRRRENDLAGGAQPLLYYSIQLGSDHSHITAESCRASYSNSNAAARQCISALLGPIDKLLNTCVLADVISGISKINDPLMTLTHRFNYTERVLK